jgi:general secretion pathway protein J
MPRRGFTLIEILLALAIFAILLGLVGTVLVQTLKTGEYLEIEGEEARVAGAILGRFEADVRNAFIPGPDDPAHFIGTKAAGSLQELRVDLVTLADAQSDTQGREADLCEAGYLLRSEDGLHWKLYRREQPMLDDKPTQGGDYLLLTDRLAGCALSYSKDGVTWQETYDSKVETRLPWAVKLNFSVLPAEGVPEGTPLPVAHERIVVLNRFGFAPNGQ